MLETKPSLDLPQDPLPNALAEVLQPIPASIKVREGHYIDTSGFVWRMPPVLGLGSIDWTRIQTTPTMLRVLMGYVAALLIGKSERYAIGAYARFSSIKDWSLITDPWELNGEIGLADLLVVQRQLKEACGGAWKDYYSTLRRLYVWAAGKGVPGFTEAVCDQLDRAKFGSDVSFVKRLDVAPGAPRSKASKNRTEFNEPTYALIAAYYHKAEGILRNGQMLFRPVKAEEEGAKEGVNCVIRKDGILLRPVNIGLSHLVLGWLAWRFGDRPDAFRKLRESHFEFIETDGEIVLAQIRMPESKILHANYKATLGPVAMGDELARLVPEFIAGNQAIRERVGLDNTLDWPLFMVALEGQSSWHRKRTTIPHMDPTTRVVKSPNTMRRDLQNLFEALQIPDGKGGFIVPIFYSFRDGFATNLIQAGTPPDVVAALRGTQVQSIRPYYKPGVRFIERLNLVSEFTQLAEMFVPADPITMNEVELEALVPVPPYVEIDEEGTQVGFTGRCGCIGAPSCPITMNGSADCYPCPAFRAIVEGPHQAVYDALWARREGLIRRGLPKQEYSRYDRNLAAIGVVIMKIQRMDGVPG